MLWTTGNINTKVFECLLYERDFEFVEVQWRLWRCFVQYVCIEKTFFEEVKEDLSCPFCAFAYQRMLSKYLIIFVDKSHIFVVFRHDVIFHYNFTIFIGLLC